MTIAQQPDSLSLSGNLKTFKVSGASADVDFILTKGDTEILHQTYTPDADGCVEIDIRRAVEDELSFSFSNSTTVQEQTAIYADFTVTIDGTTVSFRAVRCGVDRLADTPTNFLEQNFLTWQPQVKKVTYYTPEYLTYYATRKGTLKLKAYYIADDGTETTDTISVASLTAGHCYTAPMQYGVIAGLLGNKLPSYYDVWAEDASGNRLTYLQRYAADTRRSIDEDWVLFENSLGGIDCFRAYGTLDLKATHEHSTAEMGDEMAEYYVDTQRTYSKDSGLLTQREAQWLMDFFPSKAKYIYTGSYIRRIVATESSAEGAIRQEPVSFSFTFRFTDTRPLLNIARTDVPAAMLDITVPAVGSFTLPPRLSEFSHLQLAEGALFPVQDPYTEGWGVTTLGEIVEKMTASALLTEPEMWALLATGGASATYTTAQIALAHLTDALKDYTTQQWVSGQGYAKSADLSSYVTNTTLTTELAKKVDTEWFASLFTVYDSDGLKVEPNDYTKTVESIRSMFGFWTDRYLAALGKTDSVAYHEVYLTDEAGNYLLDHNGNFITTTRLLAALESGLNEDELWSLLAPDGAGDVYENAQIGLEHLTDALKEYIGTLDLSQYALSTDVTASIADVTKTLGVHTSRTDNPHGVTKAQVGLGNVENTALSTWAGTNKITTLGTITTGTWHGSKIANAYLENSSVSIAGLSVSLGGAITAADLAKKFYWANVQLSSTSSTTTTPTVKAITIGTVTLSCVDGHLKIDSGVAADGFVSALGTSDTTTTTGMSEADMWEALGTDSTNKVIPAEHLDLSGVSGGSVDLSGYYTSEQTDALLQTKTSLGHTHTTSQITDFPTSLKNPNAISIKLNGTEAASYDGSAAKTVDITPSGIGAAASSHTHSKSQITDFPTTLKNPNALSWSGYSSGSYDGSAAKSITIPNNTNQLTNGAGYITSSGSITGNAATATKLATARTLTIGSTGKTFNGSGNVSWTLAEIGAASSGHTHANVMQTGEDNTYDNTAGQRIICVSGKTLATSSTEWGSILQWCSNYSETPATSAQDNWYNQLYANTTNSLYFRTRTNGGSWTAWKKIAFTSSSDTITATNFIASSDMRLKDVQRDVEISSEALAKAPLFAFKWKDNEDKTEHIGTSAQYWQEECPQLVRDNDGKLGVDYGALGVAAGVSLAREVVELRDKVKTLEDRLAKMEAIIAKMGGEL